MANSVTRNLSFGERLGELMAWRGFNNRKLSTAIGVSEGHVSRLLQNKVGRRSSGQMLEICHVLGCEIRYLESGLGPMWPKGQEPREKAPSPDKRRRENREPPSKNSESGEFESVPGIPTVRPLSSVPPEPRKHTR